MPFRFTEEDEIYFAITCSSPYLKDGPVLSTELLYSIMGIREITGRLTQLQF